MAISRSDNAKKWIELILAPTFSEVRDIVILFSVHENNDLPPCFYDIETLTDKICFGILYLARYNLLEKNLNYFKLNTFVLDNYSSWVSKETVINLLRSITLDYRALNLWFGLDTIDQSVEDFLNKCESETEYEFWKDRLSNLKFDEVLRSDDTTFDINLEEFFKCENIKSDIRQDIKTNGREAVSKHLRDYLPNKKYPNALFNRINFLLGDGYKNKAAITMAMEEHHIPEEKYDSIRALTYQRPVTASEEDEDEKLPF